MPRFAFEAFPRALDANADPVSGGLMYIYEAGTTTPVTTYSNAAMTVAQTHPIQASSAGFFPQVYLSPGQYKVVVKTSAGATISEADNIDQTGAGLTFVMRPEDFGAVGNGTTNDTAALDAFFAALPGNVGHLTPGASYYCPTRATLPFNIPGGNFGLYFNGAQIDVSGIGLTGTQTSVITISGGAGAGVAISSITPGDNVAGTHTSITTSAAHGLSVGDEVLISSDDKQDVGYQDGTERRGQWATVSAVTSTTVFEIYEGIYDDWNNTAGTYNTNPTVKLITPVSDFEIENMRIIGPGRRASDYGDSGLAMTYCTRFRVDGSYIEGVDYQGIAMDNCRDGEVSNTTGFAEPEGANTNVQYLIAPKNGCENITIRKTTGYGWKHVVAPTRNSTNDGIMRAVKIMDTHGFGCWEAVVASHGNADNCEIVRTRAIDSLYGDNIRAPGWVSRDAYGERVSEVVRFTDHPLNVGAYGARGRDVNYVVRLPASDILIGTRRAGNITIRDVFGDNVAANTVNIAPTLPYLTEADAVVTGGDSTTITMGAFGTIDSVAWDVDGALVGAQIVMDYDGAGGGSTQTRTITGHTFSGGTNTLTVSGWTNNPQAGVSTYTISDTTELRGLVIDGVHSQNCDNTDVYIKGAWKRPVFRSIHADHDTPTAAPALWLDSTANKYSTGAVMEGISWRNKDAPQITTYAEGVEWRDDITPEAHGAKATGVSTDDDTAAITSAVDFASMLHINFGLRKPVVCDGTYWWGETEAGTDATSGWRHLVYVPANVTIKGDGLFKSSILFADKAVGFTCRGDNLRFDGLRFEDTATAASNYIIPIGGGTTYDDSLTTATTYTGLDVVGCEMDNAWLSASIQMSGTVDATIKWDDIEFRDCKSRVRSGVGSAGNFNMRSDPPGLITNGRMVGCEAYDGVTASSFNFVGVYGLTNLGNTSYRNAYAGSEIENGCQDGICGGFRSHDEAIAVWIDDSRRIVWNGISTENSAAHIALRITREGFTGDTSYETTGIVVSNIAGYLGEIDIDDYGTGGGGTFGSILVNGYDYLGTGLTGGYAVTLDNLDSAEITFDNFTIHGAETRAISAAIASGATVKMRNVRTAKVGAEASSGIVTSGAGDLWMHECEFHSETIGHTGKTIGRTISDADGDYRYHWDGTLEIWHEINLGSAVASGAGTLTSPYRSATTNWTFPAAFSAAPVVTCLAYVDAASGTRKAEFGTLQNVSATVATGVQAYRMSDDATADDVKIMLHAKGDAA